jgi:peptidoglycan/xylan/chitin deacetylase (PgdA/CDA1 family)
MCLLYHRVDEPGEFGFLDTFGAPTITPDGLAGDLKFLQDRGAKFMTFADLRRGEFPDASQFGVIVSFDDGFRDNYTHGLSVLDALRIQGVVFQSTALIDADTLIWEHALYWYWHDKQMAQALTELARLQLPDARQLQGASLLRYLCHQVPAPALQAVLNEMRERFESAPALSDLADRLYPTASHLRMANLAHHELGSHGHNHYVRTSLDDMLFENELRRSVEVIERITSERPRAFSYPFNSYMPNDSVICARYFEQVVTVDASPIERGFDPLSLPRFTWPGPARNGMRRRRWLLTGRI